MVFNNEKKTKKVVINTCNCGCGSEIQIKRYILCGLLVLKSKFLFFGGESHKTRITN